MHYESLFVIPGIMGDAATIKIATKSSQAGDYTAQCSYSDHAVNVDGVATLLDPIALTYTAAVDFDVAKGKYLSIDGAVYLVSSTAVFSDGKLTGSYGVVVQVYIQCSAARLVEKAELRMGVGHGQLHPIMSSKITSYSNDSDDYLDMGSVCASILEATFMCKGHRMSIPPGEEITAYKIRVDDNGTRTQEQTGIFACEEPEQVSAYRYKVVGYDCVRKLDKDISVWLNSLTGWPYKINTFKSMVAAQCGLTVESETDVDRYVHKFTAPEGTTGRQVMRWIGECECQYCIATPQGTLKFAWYSWLKLTGITTNFRFVPSKPSSGEHFYFRGTMSYDDYNIADASSFEVVADEEAMEADIAARGDDGKNPYYLVGNPIILNHPYYLDRAAKPSGSAISYYTNWMTMVLAQNYSSLKQFRPFTLTTPEDQSLKVGKVVSVETAGGDTFDSYITEIECSGGRMTVSCKGKKNRQDYKSPSDMSNREIINTAVKRSTPADTGWIDLGISDAVSLPSAANQHGHYVGCGYRVVGKMVYVAANVAFTYSGDTGAVIINTALIPEEYRPAHNVYCDAWCNGRNLARAFVSTTGNVAVEYVQSLTTGSSTTAFTANWIDIWIQYFLD